MERFVTEKEYKVHFYEIDCNKRVLTESILNYLGDIAMEQTRDIGVELDTLYNNNLSWVLYNWDVTIKRYPKYLEKLKVRTWPYSMRKFYAYRQFEILDQEDNVLCTANSVWFLIDFEKRKPKKIMPEVYKAYRLSEENNDKLEIEKLKEPGDITCAKSFNVRYSDIDTNQHVNNAKYLAWCTETVPMDIINNYQIERFIVCYEKETYYGEVVDIKTEVTYENEKVICHHLINDKEGNKLTLVKTVWCKNEV